MARYGAKNLAVVMYHQHVPRPDPMTNPDTLARAKTYSVTGVPTFAIDGKKTVGGGSREGTKNRYDLITKDMVKPGAAVIDVGTTWVGGKQVGDLGAGVDEVAGWLTPNPGGVGPMTRAMLIKNAFQAEARRRP